jgi:iron complex transport system substrate-binding protein
VSLYPERIICLTEETTETLYLLGEEDRIIGISGFTYRPPEARKNKPKVSAFVDADIPKIEALSPDLILAFSDIQADITRELVKRGHTVMTFNQRSLDEIYRAIITTGAFVGRSQEAKSLVESYQERITKIQARTARYPKRLKVYFEEWPDPMISTIRWVSELIDIAGGEDIFKELREAGLAKGRIINPADVVERAPDIIIGSWCGKMVKKQEILERDGWGSIPAIKNNQVHEINSTLILQPGPAALTDGLDALVSIIENALEKTA